MTEPASPEEDPRWIALSKARQQELLNNFRHVNTEDFEWWDFTYEEFEDDLLEIGLTVKRKNGENSPEIYFSGFYCQGDGASFGSEVHEPNKFLAAIGHEKWAAWWGKQDWQIGTSIIGTNNMRVDTELDVPENPFSETEEPLQFHTWQITQAPPTPAEIKAIEKDATEKLEGLAKKLYRDLRDEYEFLTSDEVVIDWILNNRPEDLEEEDDG